MLFGLGDNNYDYAPPHQVDENDLLDEQIASLKAEIKAIEKEIQTKEAAALLQEDVSKEKKQRELADLEKQVANLTKAVEHENSRVNHYQSEIIRRETKQPPPPQPDTNDETVSQLMQQSEQLTEELKQIQSDLIAEVGEDYDVDEIIKTGGSSKKRADELQSLQALVSKNQSTYVDARRLDEINEAGKKIRSGVDTLVSQKQQLTKDISSLKEKVSKYQKKANALEEQNRALKTMDVLLTEKIQNDQELLSHLEEIDNQRVHELPEPEVTPVSYDFISQLHTQLQIVRGLCWKLCLAQKEVSNYQVPEQFSFLADQLSQINKRCIQLENAFIAREDEATEQIVKYLEQLEEE
ncbi:hypothetical protein TVAG_267680 [Trichomonas vaginalis G3]|uniref:Uncharacterized protein n=1 Tax=Trichomonas vaginalis (strain ATCC PRA-98 / G3) TaxID=412133 RepID=A2DLB8_TRIV3|nr:hypothetical protein TVAGG3_0714590 [Trichomonas vaginalis G3]EAY18736.1 hypothetical protein TVAG_267680 [Trichomonas vaginalis G3]KAI5510156.1 hypothetical protein TVAGG3_0714590 [Trichomonas vaginalis G3]|eukprot:XP_001579722.1 hypothetical protein [Trichomonas vaginalis G3]